MKYLISIAIAVAAFFAVGFSLDGFTRMKGDDIGVFASIAGIIALTVSLFKINTVKGLFKINTVKGGAKIASDTIGAVKDIKENIESSVGGRHADLYAKAEEEYDSGEIDKGLWSQALIKAKGDEKLRKVEYMKLRAKQHKKKT
ncbi:MAG: hypothetical protein P8R04_07675 [Gammaproteobacteria bacterium]|nr:hypothetical protein [Gammaproteobacteria bacterium]